MNYLDNVDVTQHDSWDVFRKFVTDKKKRLILLSTKAETTYTKFTFRKKDILMVGRESAGDSNRAAAVRTEILGPDLSEPC